MKQEPKPVLASTGRQEHLSAWLPLWIGAALLLFVHLGFAPIMGSEARWAVITREMFRNHDFFHPTINGEPYFDKPLLTYWFIALPALFNRGMVTELIARIPSALAALAALGALIALTRELYDKKTALTAGWLMVGCYSFAFWGRLAEADMANLAFCTAAAAWYIHFRSSAGYRAYAGFFLICSIGAHAKGMAAFAVPILTVLADIIIEKSWKRHFGNWKLYAGAVTGLAVYAVPFVLSTYFPPAVPVKSFAETGVSLAFRENVTRFFRPFDHVEPFYAYFIHVPRQLFLWAPLALFAFFATLFRWKKENKQERMLILSIILIFLFFSASGSKRHYYIMPILPFFFTLTAAFISRTEENLKLEKVKQILFTLYRIIPIAFAGIAAVGLALLTWTPLFRVIPVPKNFASHLFFSCFLCFLAMLFGYLMCRFMAEESGKERPDRRLLSFLVPVFLANLFFFGFMSPAVSSMRTLRPSAKRMGSFLTAANVPPDQIVFCYKTFNDTFFYLNPPSALKVLQAKELETHKGGIFVIADKRTFEKLPVSLQTRLKLVMQEYSTALENRKKTGKKIQLRFLVPARKQVPVRQKNKKQPDNIR